MADIRELADRLLDGELATILAEKRANGVTFDDIARWLADEHNIGVSRETVRRWCFGPESPEQVA